MNILIFFIKFYIAPMLLSIIFEMAIKSISSKYSKDLRLYT